jgi:signal transduction histidine kinase
MTETIRPVRVRDSVFVRLMAVMVGLSLAVPLAVGGFFLYVVHPTLDRAASALTTDYMELFAASRPDLETARRAGTLNHFDLRYEGPAGGWSTAPDVPSAAQLNDASTGWARAVDANSRVVIAPDGGRYVFVWQHDHALEVAHDRMVVGLLVLLVAVLSGGHYLLRRTFRPLRWLADGVARVAGGDFGATVPQRSRDELGALTEAFNQMVAQVRDMVRARDQLLLDVSHELRSPLTRMKVALALGVDATQHERLGAYVAEMEALVTELLELERLRHGRGLELARHDLVALTRETLAAFTDIPPGVELGAAPEACWLTLDGDKIRSVIGNLLENAVKYALPDSRPIRVSLEVEDGIVLSVSDDGPGIAPGDRATLFEPFFRADRSRSRKTGGFGLGLSLCRRIMEAHGGRITLADRRGRGATFLLHFPNELVVTAGAP